MISYLEELWMYQMGKRIVFSTHSSIIGQVFYLLHKYKPNPEKIQTLIDNVMKVENTILFPIEDNTISVSAIIT